MFIKNIFWYYLILTQWWWHSYSNPYRNSGGFSGKRSNYKFIRNMGFLFISMSSRPSNFYVIKVFFLQNKSVSNHLKCEIFISVRMLISCQNHLCKEISLSLSLELLPPEKIFCVCTWAKDKIFHFKWYWNKGWSLDKIQHQSKRDPSLHTISQWKKW